MSILDFFSEDMVEATITRTPYTIVDGVKTPGTPTLDTVDCLFWEGSAAEAYISERFRDVTVAAIAVPAGTDIQKNDKITVGGVSYHALPPDNVGAADEVMHVALKVFA